MHAHEACASFLSYSVLAFLRVACLLGAHKLFSGFWSNMNTIRRALQANRSRARTKYTCTTVSTPPPAKSSHIHSNSSIFTSISGDDGRTANGSICFSENLIRTLRGKRTSERMRSNDLRVFLGGALYVRNGRVSVAAKKLKENSLSLLCLCNTWCGKVMGLYIHTLYCFSEANVRQRRALNRVENVEEHPK